MERVVVTRNMAGGGLMLICHMQVCAVKDATDEEILEVCNRENPSGTTNGWVRVIRSIGEDDEMLSDGYLPVECDDDADRLHFMVGC
jgi:hypothetical protein